MNREQLTLALIRDTIAQAPLEEREKIETAIAEMRTVMVKHGAWGSLALAMLGAELAASA